MKTPSWKINQPRDENYFQDKYIGRMPKMLHSIPEADIYVCNPEYLDMLNEFIEGTLNESNLSAELYAECSAMVDLMAVDPGLWSIEDGKIMACFDEKYPGIITPDPTCDQIVFNDDLGEYWFVNGAITGSLLNDQVIHSYDYQQYVEGDYHGFLKIGPSGTDMYDSLTSIDATITVGIEIRHIYLTWNAADQNYRFPNSTVFAEFPEVNWQWCLGESPS